MLKALEKYNGDSPERAALELEKLAVTLSKLPGPTHQSACHEYLYAYHGEIRHKTRWIADLPKLSIVTDAASPRSSSSENIGPSPILKFPAYFYDALCACMLLQLVAENAVHRETQTPSAHV